MRDNNALPLRPMNVFARIGRWFLEGASHVGRLTYFVIEAIRGLGEVRIWWPRMMVEAWNIGAGSLFIVLLISAFAGAVTALQTGYQFTGSIPYYVVGTMRVTEQIDALESLGRSPASHLVIPRVLAGLLMIPALTVLANLSGVLSGWISVKAVLPVTDADFIYGAQYYWRPWDAWYSVIKAFFFAGSITIISCYMGFNTQQGAEGVGKSTTTAVVASSVLILVLDTVLTRLLLNQ